ncbi:MAG: hypothetical protein WKG00_35830 [Polyangiaceae bacterium]
MIQPLRATLVASLVSTLCACGIDQAGTPAGADGGAGGATSSVASGAGGGSTGGQGGGGQATCGDGACGQGETCTSCPADCGACEPIPCPSEGGVFCGGNGVGGDAETLYVCHDGFLEVLEACGAGCQWMPLGTPDQCPTDTEVPASLVDALEGTPYVEQSCTPITYDAWPYSALQCTYSAGGLTTTVITATPSPERVAAWIVDAASYIPALQALKGVEQGAYEQGLVAMAKQVVGQSSRIFPLQGGIIENITGEYIDYPFLNGVTDGCSSGCYCRINSLHRTTWCAYQEALGQSYDDCIATVGSSRLTEGWGAQCLGNHKDAWNSDANEHFRAKAWEANLGISSACPPDQCSPGEVVDAVDGAYNPQ